MHVVVLTSLQSAYGGPEAEAAAPDQCLEYDGTLPEMFRVAADV
jgi:hypothetical protein